MQCGQQGESGKCRDQTPIHGQRGQCQRQKEPDAHGRLAGLSFCYHLSCCQTSRAGQQHGSSPHQAEADDGEGGIWRDVGIAKRQGRLHYQPAEGVRMQ